MRSKDSNEEKEIQYFSTENLGQIKSNTCMLCILNFNTEDCTQSWDTIENFIYRNHKESPNSPPSAEEEKK